MKKAPIKVCPKCGSTVVSCFTKAGGYFGENLMYFCQNCYYGYFTGGFFPEMSPGNIKKLKGKIKKKPARRT